jgi:hypothetical protein
MVSFVIVCLVFAAGVTVTATVWVFLPLSSSSRIVPTRQDIGSGDAVDGFFESGWNVLTALTSSAVSFWSPTGDDAEGTDAERTGHVPEMRKRDPPPIGLLPPAPAGPKSEEISGKSRLRARTVCTLWTATIGQCLNLGQERVVQSRLLELYFSREQGLKGEEDR